jgi:hypothetical protein
MIELYEIWEITSVILFEVEEKPKVAEAQIQRGVTSASDTTNS